MLENARCNEYPDRGTCEDRGFTIKWYYDRYAHRCREFHYGGCEGNGNRFDSFEECSQECRYEPLDDPSRRCVLPHDPGSCADNFERWHFDIRIRQCVCSWWSGCGGNSNMFYSYAHCMSVCGIYADNRTSSNKMTFRRFIPEPKINRIRHVNGFTFNETVLSGKERKYRNLFITSSSDNDRGLQRSRLQYRKPLPEKRLRPINVRNDQHGDAQLTRRYQYLQYNPYKHSIAVSNRFKQEPKREHSIRMMAHKRERVSEASDKRRQEKMVTSGVRNGQSREQSIYSRPQEIRQSSPIRINQTTYLLGTTVTPSSEYLREKHIEAYIQQKQAYERSQAEALRERDRLIQQHRRDEYERMLKYARELQQYQQAVQSAQNRVPKKRVQANNADVERQQQQLWSQRHYLKAGKDQNAAEVRRTKLKHRKLLNFEKLKQIEKDRKLLKTTPKSLQLKWWMQQQQQQQQQQSEIRSEKTIREQQQLQRQIWSDKMKEQKKDSQRIQADPSKRSFYISQPQHQHQIQSYQTSSDLYEKQDQRKLTIYNKSNTGMSVTNELSQKSELDSRPVNEVPGISRNPVSIEPELDQSEVNQSANDGNWHRSQMQPNIEHFPFEMILTADRISDGQDVHVTEIINAIPSPTEDFNRQKQMVTIEDYEEEDYTYDQESENEDHLRDTSAEFVEGRWTVTLAVQPTPPLLTFHPTDSFTDAPETEAVTDAMAAKMGKRKESGTEIDMIEIIPSKHDNEDHNVEILKSENETEENDDEIMFWQKQK